MRECKAPPSDCDGPLAPDSAPVQTQPRPVRPRKATPASQSPVAPIPPEQDEALSTVTQADRRELAWLDRFVVLLAHGAIREEPYFCPDVASGDTAEAAAAPDKE
jgi:hypothetical protein